MIKKKGFTLIEVTLFLGITGLLLIGVLASTWTSISEQRSNDIVQNFSDFLQTQYSAVANVQSNGSGNSDLAIYGKVITFGEENANGKVYVYDLVGKAVNSDTVVRLSIPEMLELVDANVLAKTENDAHHSFCSYKTYNQSFYTTRYGADIKNTNENDFVGAIIITRSPSSGSIHTFAVQNTTIEIQKVLKDLEDAGGNLSCDKDPFGNVVGTSYNNLEKQEIDFCLTSEYMNGRIYDVRLKKDASNSTGVEIISLDDTEANKCEK